MKKILLCLLVLASAFPVGALENDPDRILKQVERDYQESRRNPALGIRFEASRAEAEKAQFFGSPDMLKVQVSPFDQAKGAWTLTLESTDPALPYRGQVTYSAQDGARSASSHPDAKQVPELMELGQLRGRLVYGFHFAPEGSQPRWELHFSSVELGSLGGAGFRPVFTQGISGTGFLTLTADTRRHPEPARMKVEPLALAKAKAKGPGQILVYGTDACGNTQYLRQQLDEQKVTYTYYNIDADQAKAAQMWSKIWASQGDQVESISLPVVEVGGNVLISPEVEEVLAKAGTKPATPEPPAVTAAPNTSGASDFQAAMLAELNFARTDPSGYAESRLKVDYQKGRDNGAYRDLKSRRPLAPLTLNPQLNAAANDFATYLAKTGRFSHEADGRSPFQRMKAAGYKYSWAGENLACGSYPEMNAQTEPQKAGQTFVKQLIIDSGVSGVGHRENILNKNFKEVGIGFGRNTATRYQNFVVEDFGATR